MSENKDLEEETLEETTETVELHKPTIPVQKVSKIPNFPNANQFRGGFNNMNQKQRPGRAAARGR